MRPRRRRSGLWNVCILGRAARWPATGITPSDLRLSAWVRKYPPDLSLILRRRGLPSLPHRRIDLCIREAARGDRASGGCGPSVEVGEHGLCRERRMFPSVSPAPRLRASRDTTFPLAAHLLRPGASTPWAPERFGRCAGFPEDQGLVGVRWRRMTEVMVARRAQCCGICHQGRRHRDGSCGGMSIAPRPGQARHVGQRKQVRADVGKYHVKRQVRGPLVRQPRTMHQR